MEKKEIKIPLGINYLTEYDMSQIGQLRGRCFLDKGVTGCGATSAFLNDNIPTILCSPRKHLLCCKAESPYHKEKVHLFRPDGDYARSVHELQNDLEAYINKCYYSAAIPKILVTYDSFKYVVDCLQKIGILQNFRVIVDEVQCLWSDASFKAGTMLEFLVHTRYCQNVIFLSARPYIEDYLDNIEEFRNIPYVKLVWPQNKIPTVNIIKRTYGSVIEEVGSIIQHFNHNGYFMSKIKDGQEIYSKEAVFFLNNVNDICSIIKKFGLTPDNTNIICAETEENKKRLKKLNHTVGSAPQNGEHHKTFTFCTKCAYEGVDFYSTCASTYIFSNINIDSMALDISLDLPQILGRQRRSDNPFRYDAYFYYRTNFSYTQELHDNRKRIIQDKWELTEESIFGFESLRDSVAYPVLVEKCRTAQEHDRYSKDYISVIDNIVEGNVCLMLNHLAAYSEIRAWDIQASQYLCGDLITNILEESIKPITKDPILKDFLNRYNHTNDFKIQLKEYCETLKQHPEYKELLEDMPQIKETIKKYFNSLGPDRLRALSYKESQIREVLGITVRTEEIRNVIAATFLSGQFYTNSTVKTTLQNIYNDLSIPKKAKATDLANYISCKEVKRKNAGTRESGYQIL